MAHQPVAAAGYRTQPLLDFVTKTIAREDAVLREIRETTEAKGLPAISVGADEGRLLHFLASSIGARKIVEVGTLAGYSACWLARSLPEGGMLHTIEYDPKHAKVAKENVELAGLTDKVTVHVGAGSAILPTLEKHGPYDLAFIDADKTGYDAYCERCLTLLRPGGLIAIDNTLWNGSVARPAKDADTAALQALNTKLHGDARIDLSLLPIGDGLTLARKR